MKDTTVCCWFDSHALSDLHVRRCLTLVNDRLISECKSVEIMDDSAIHAPMIRTSPLQKGVPFSKNQCPHVQLAKPPALGPGTNYPPDEILSSCASSGRRRVLVLQVPKPARPRTTQQPTKAHLGASLKVFDQTIL
mmetsp:Transcript_49587/g.73889  ORF Transcript_49587/g.73889 Transcript_49587/m.73889 type:complete len:136 (+) Transcript_49587:436-843(+)